MLRVSFFIFFFPSNALSWCAVLRTLYAHIPSRLATTMEPLLSQLLLQSSVAIEALTSFLEDLAVIQIKRNLHKSVFLKSITIPSTQALTASDLQLLLLVLRSCSLSCSSELEVASNESVFEGCKITGRRQAHLIRTIFVSFMTLLPPETISQAGCSVPTGKEEWDVVSDRVESSIYQITRTILSTSSSSSSSSQDCLDNSYISLCRAQSLSSVFMLLILHPKISARCLDLIPYSSRYISLPLLSSMVVQSIVLLCPTLHKQCLQLLLSSFVSNSTILKANTYTTPSTLKAAQNKSYNISIILQQMTFCGDVHHVQQVLMTQLSSLLTFLSTPSSALHTLPLLRFLLTGTLSSYSSEEACFENFVLPIKKLLHHTDAKVRKMGLHLFVSLLPFVRNEVLQLDLLNLILLHAIRRFDTNKKTAFGNGSSEGELYSKLFRGLRTVKGKLSTQCLTVLHSNVSC